MKYPYSNPNFGIFDFFKSLFITKNIAKKRIKQYFSKITEKKYVLITNSCRTALFLAYKSIANTGEVITSPLTCKVALDPITESDNLPVYADINTGDLNINPAEILNKVSKKSIAIQAIHLGGVSCDMNKINEIAKRNNLLIIEDCAQSLGAKFNNKLTGSYGDIACFSLIKNGYSIGGGVFATNNEEFFRRATEINNKLHKAPLALILYRILRNIIYTNNKYWFFKKLQYLLFNLKGGRASYKSVTAQLFKASTFSIKIAAYQIKRYSSLHSKRKEVGKRYFNLLNNSGVLFNNKYTPENASFTKMFLYNPGIETTSILKDLHKKGIEAMHLEQKQGSPYQKRVISKKQAYEQKLFNYDKIHDSIISLPVSEDFDKQDILFICNVLKEIISKQDNT